MSHDASYQKQQVNVPVIITTTRKGWGGMAQTVKAFGRRVLRA